jgi:large subunit ribosomal protein L19
VIFLLNESVKNIRILHGSDAKKVVCSSCDGFAPVCPEKERVKTTLDRRTILAIISRFSNKCQKRDFMNIVQKIRQEQANQDRHPDFVIGDTIRVHYKIKEGGKERIQIFTGTVIARKGSGNTEAITVRRISYGEGVERVFPLNSPNIDKIEIDRYGKVRRAKLYYLRDLAGKKARIKERRV